MAKKHTLFLAAALIYILGVILYANVSYRNSKEKALTTIDKNLKSIAQTADFFLKQYHNKVVAKGSITPEEYEKINQQLNLLNSYFDSTYIYSFVKNEGRVHFSSSSYTQQNVSDNKVSLYYDEYKEATHILKSAFEETSAVYEESEDQWGQFRSIFLPCKSLSGQEYVIGVDIEITFIKKLLFQKLITTTFTGLFFLVLIIPFCIIYIVNLKRDKLLLEQLVAEKTEALQKSNEGLNRRNEELATLSNKLSKYLAPQIYDSLFQGRMDVKIDSKNKKLTVFFSDIKDFTKLSQNLSAEELTKFLNIYLKTMADIANKYGATIDKFIGDAIMIFFGDPSTEGPQSDAINCVQMALEMQEKIKEMRKEEPFNSLPQQLSVRIGITTGICTVGNFGSQNQINYTIIGNEVNLASRLETNAQPDTILISSQTYEYIKEEIECLPLGEIKVKGFENAIQTYRALKSKVNQKTILNSAKFLKPTHRLVNGSFIGLSPANEPKQAILESAKNRESRWPASEIGCPSIGPH